MRQGLGFAVCFVQLVFIAGACSDALQNPAEGNAGSSGAGSGGLAEAGEAGASPEAAGAAGDGGTAGGAGAGELGGFSGTLLGGSGGTTAGSGGTTAGSGGTTAGSGGTTAGSGGTPAGSGGTTAGSGGTTAGSGGTTAGSGGTTPGCSGTAVACADLADPLCEPAWQCFHPVSPCTKLNVGPAWCANLPQQTCAATTGCVWTGGTPACSISTTYCPSFTNEAACLGSPPAAVCKWSNPCLGTADCSQLSTAEQCATQPGCSWH